MKTESKLDPSYVVQDGCWNCAHRFERYDYEVPDYDPFELYCNFTNDRPKCGSARMDEGLHLSHNASRPDQAAWKIWKDWAEPRKVTESGICERHRVGEPE